MRNKYLQFGLGMIVGGLLCGTTAAAADYLRQPQHADLLSQRPARPV